MSKIIGITVGSQLPKPNLNQTDPTKGDYIKGSRSFINDVTNLKDLVGDTSVAEQIGDALENSKADWSVNDESSAAYIKNRTHYTEVVSILPETTLSSPTNREYIIKTSYDREIVLSKTYTINFEGEQYICEAKNHSDIGLYLGNASLSPLTTEPDTGEPFCFYLINSYYSGKLLINKDSVSHPFSISETIIHKLPYEYIHTPDWNAQEGQPGYIKNLPLVDATSDILPETTLEDENGEMGFTEPLPGGILVAGNTYIVTYNGVDYICEAIEFDFSNGEGIAVGVMLGNVDAVINGDLTIDGPPFIFGWLPSEAAALLGAHAILNPLDGSTIATIRIRGGKMIDPKVLPDSIPWEEPSKVILPETTFIESEGHGGLYPNSIVANETYNITWNGTTYKCVAELFTANGDTAIICGNINAMLGGESTGEPFVVIAPPPEKVEQVGYNISIMGVDSSSAEEVTVSISTDPVIHKMPLKYHRVPDWNAGENEEGHILNRTHWETKSIVILPETTITEVGAYNPITLLQDIELGKEYPVIYNGVEYKCVAQSAGENALFTMALTNVPIDSDEEPTFAILKLTPPLAQSFGAPYAIVANDNPESITVKIVIGNDEIHKLDQKFLPDYNWEASEGEEGHILNRTHYEEPVKQILEQTTITNMDGSPISVPMGLIEGKEYAVIVNGVEYDCVAKITEIPEGIPEEYKIIFENSIQLKNEVIEIIEFNKPFNGAYGIATHLNYAELSEDPVFEIRTKYALKKLDSKFLPEISSVEVDATLSVEGMAADAKAVGDAIAGIEIPSIDGLASENYVDIKVAELVNAAPETLNTLNELATALGDDPNFATTIATEIGTKMNAHNSVGTGSFSMGRKEGTAIGTNSVAIGNDTIATGYYSHAEGSSTVAEGLYAHAEGNNTYAYGQSSHAEGINTMAYGTLSHAEGNSDYGIMQITGDANTRTYTTSADLAKVGQVVMLESTKMIAKIMEKTNTTITLSRTLSNIALSNADIRFYTGGAGGSGSHTEGHCTIANGDYSHAEGNNTQTDGDYAHAEGVRTQAIGDYSHAEGASTEAIGDYSHAEGEGTIAYGNFSHAEGCLNSSTTVKITGVANTVNYTTDSTWLWKVIGQIISYNNKYAKIIDFNTDENILILDRTLSSIDLLEAPAKVLYQCASGFYSHSEGKNNCAIGNSSHAEGNGTEARGDASHAEGNDTKTIGHYSHAEGWQTEASGKASHAEGNSTKAIGDHSHAEGFYTTANEVYSHAEGEEAIASGRASHAEGFRTKAASSYQHVIGNRNIVDAEDKYVHIVGNGYTNEYNGAVLSNAYTLDWQGNAWYSGDVYVGSTSGTNKDEGSKKLATESYVDEKIETAAVPVNSVNGKTGEVVLAASDIGAMSATNPTGTGSLSIGRKEGSTLYAYSFALGQDVIANGWALATGNNTTASGSHSLAAGRNTTASGTYSCAVGYNTIASGDGSFAMGTNTIASGISSFAEGNGMIAGGKHSHAEGYGSAMSITISGDANALIYNVSSIPSSITVGSGIVFNNISSIITEIDKENLTITLSKTLSSEALSAVTAKIRTGAFGDYSHAEGMMSTASGESSHAEGRSGMASGIAAHAEGSETEAIGAGSHTEGHRTVAKGVTAHAEGYATIATSDRQHAQGQYNIEDSEGKYAHIVGNGTSSSRSNAHTLDWDGNAWYSGDVYVGSTSGANKDEGSKKLATEEYVNNLVRDSITLVDQVTGQRYTICMRDGNLVSTLAT